MKKNIFILFSFILSITSFSQDVIGTRVIARQSLFVKDNWVDSLRRDTIGWQNDSRTLPTTGAVYKFVAGRMGSGTPGSGTVTNVGTGYGLIGGPITTTGTIVFDSTTVFPQLRSTITNGVTDTANKWIWNQYGAQQDANAWFDSLALKNLRMGNIDSAYLLWFDSQQSDGGWAYFRGKMLDIRDIDTVTSANDDWLYSQNENALIQRVTRLVPGMSAHYRDNFLASQIWEVGNAGGSINTQGGDLNSTIKSYTRVTNRAGQTTGRMLVDGGSTLQDAVPMTISAIEVSPKDEAVGTSTRRAGGYWAGYSSYHNLYAGDSLDHWIGYMTGGFSLGGKFLSHTHLYIPITTVTTMSTLNWGVYNPDYTGGNSYNLFGGHVGIGDINYGTHTVPTFKSSGALQINSVTRGFITSRMTAAQRIAIPSPDSALFVFDSDSLRYLGHNSAAWKGVAWTSDIMDLQGTDVASVAGAISLGTIGSVFEITGTNAITLISNVNFQNGALITIAFTSTATLTDGTANSGTDIGMELAGNTNFVASAGATLALRLIEIGGTQRWREVSRSVQ